MKGIEVLQKTTIDLCKKRSRTLDWRHYSTRHLRNLDSQGLGPEGRFLIGKKVVYSRDAFPKWLETRVKAPQKKK